MKHTPALLKQQEGIIGIEVVRTADLRYQKQAHEISVELRPDDSAADVVTRFEQRHREAYGTVLGDPITVVTFRTTVGRADFAKVMGGNVVRALRATIG